MSKIDPPDRFPDTDARNPRFCEVGHMTLDRAYRDGRVEDRWLGLERGEFELLWQLAHAPRRRLSAAMMENAPADALAGVCGKLAFFGLAAMVRQHADGGVSLDAPPGPSAFTLPTPLGV